MQDAPDRHRVDERHRRELRGNVRRNFFDFRRGNGNRRAPHARVLRHPHAVAHGKPRRVPADRGDAPDALASGDGRQRAQPPVSSADHPHVGRMHDRALQRDCHLAGLRRGHVDFLQAQHVERFSGFIVDKGFCFHVRIFFRVPAMKPRSRAKEKKNPPPKRHFPH